MLETSRRVARRRVSSSQLGVTLPIVLILLIVVTVLGIAGARIALLGERSTRFDRDYQIAWEAAEAALVDAEFDIDGPNAASGNRVALFTTDNSSRQYFATGCGTAAQNQGLCDVSATATPVWQTINFVDQSGTPPFVIFGTKTGRGNFTSGTGIAPAQPPHYIIEQVPDVRAGADKNAVLYRITSIGFGPNLQTQVTMQSVYAKE